MADKFWRPTEGAIPAIRTVTITGTPATSDTVSVTIGGSTLTVTVGDATTTNDVAEALSAAINATNTTVGLIGTESRNAGGQQLPEFRRVSAHVPTGATNTVIVTGVQPGEPVSVSVAKTGTVAIASADTQDANGPNHVDDASNWSGGTLPATTDRMIFDQGSVSALYGMAYFRDNTIDCSVLVTGDFKGDIGLPWWNPNGYIETLDRYFELYDASGAQDLEIVPGTGGGICTGTLRFDAQSQTWDEIRVLGGLQPANQRSTPQLEIHGGSVDVLQVNTGWVAIDPDDAEQTGGMTPDDINIGATDGSTVNPRVSLGKLTAFNASDTPIDVLGGLLEVFNALDPGTAEATPVNLYGGIVKVYNDGDILNATIRKGTLEWIGNGTSNGTITVWGDGTLDVSKDGRAKSFGTITAYSGATFKLGVQTPTITPTGCNLEDLNISR